MGKLKKGLFIFALVMPTLSLIGRKFISNIGQSNLRYVLYKDILIL